MEQPSAHPAFAAILGRLEPLPKDQYVTAFGPGDRCFLGNAEGFIGSDLPEGFVERLASASDAKVSFASFGSHPDEWFLAFEKPDGTFSYHLGEAVTPTVQEYLNSLNAPHHKRTLARVQFGTAGSFLAWNASYWVSNNLPNPLYQFLQEISCSYNPKATGGMFNGAGHPTSIAWHHDGTFFVIGQEKGSSSIHQTYRVWDFGAEAINNAWKLLWDVEGADQPRRAQLALLVHVAINPHSPSCDVFLFIKAGQAGRAGDSVLQFGPDSINVKLTPIHHELQLHPQANASVRWARAIKRGRPHLTDPNELMLEKNEKLKVLEIKDNDWFRVANKSGKQGIAHRAWIEMEKFADAKQAYTQFQEDCANLIEAGNVTQFPVLNYYAQFCCLDACKATKEMDEGVGICLHDLRTLLQGDASYSCAFLKQERKKWHPDMFARFCAEEHQDELKNKASQVFDMMGALMDELGQKRQGAV